MSRYRLLGLALICGLAGWIADASAQAKDKLVVGTKPLAPFVHFDGNPTDPQRGFSIDLWKAIARELGCDFEWKRYEKIGELIGAVEHSKVDVAIAGISITARRETKLDFSLSMFDAGLQVMLPVKQEVDLADVVSAVITPTMLEILVGGLIVLLLFAHLMWLFERRHNDAIAERYLAGLGDALWWTVVTVSTVGYGDVAPKTRAGRVLAVCWILVSLFAVTGFVASASSALTVTSLQQTITGPGDLPGHRVAAVQGSTAAEYLRRRARVGLVEYPRLRDVYTALEQGRVDAAVYDAPVLLHYASHEGQGKVEVIGPIFRKEAYGIAFPTGSPWREKVNRALLSLRETGEYQLIFAKHFGGSDR